MSLSPPEGLAVGHGLAGLYLSLSLSLSQPEIFGRRSKTEDATKISVCGGAAGSLVSFAQTDGRKDRLVLTDGGKTKSIAWRGLVP